MWIALAALPAVGCVAHQTRVVGISVEGRPIECRVLGRGSDVVLIMATIHGNESAGTPLVRRLDAHLHRHPDLLASRRVVLLPVVNPDGMAHGTRINARGVDLNRNFPADNFAGTARHGRRPLCEPESRAIKAVLDEYVPARIVSIHQPMAQIDYDGPAEQLAWAMGRYTDLPVKRIGSLPGSLGSYAGLTRGIPIITLELPRPERPLGREPLWRRYGRALLAAITFPDPPR
ncbi:MAG: murein peptide amidase A [bacterium]|nr:murein peptide amidase A [bacterium]